MALIKCNECGREISDKAQNCIHCGNPIINELNKGHVIVKFKLPKNQAITSPAIKFYDKATKKELAKVKVENTEDFWIDNDMEIYAKQIFVKSNTIKISANKETKIVATFAGALNNKFVINEVDYFVE